MSERKGRRELADRALRERLAPLLEDEGFAGRYPHWHRVLADGEAWMVSVSHDKYGGAFGAQLGWMPPRKLMPVLDPPRPRSAARLRAWSVHPELTHDPKGGFLRYDADLARATRRVAEAVGAAVPAWFLHNARIALRLGPQATAATLARLEKEALWVRRWVEEHPDFDGCRARLRAKLRAATSTEDRAWLAWKLAKGGDTAAHALLVELLDDPPVQTRYRSEPGASFRAAQALADLHGWPYRWGGVAAIKRRVAAASGRQRAR